MTPPDHQSPAPPPDGPPVVFGGDDLAACLTLLDDAVAVTVNSAAMISHVGAYGRPSMTGEPLVHDDQRVNLRIHPAAVRAMITTDPAGGAQRPVSLQILNRSQAAVHRSYAPAAKEQMALNGLRLSHRRFGGITRNAAEPRTPTPHGWSAADQLDHLDAIIIDGGARRHATLPRLDHRDTVEVGLDAVLHLLAHLCESHVHLTIAVPSAGCLQFHRGTVNAISLDHGTLTAWSGTTTLALETGRVTDCWLVRSPGVHGMTSAIELYDHAGHCLAILTQLGSGTDETATTWERFAGYLPQM